MVIGAFPAAKLGALLLKQVSKPIANFIILKAKSSPIFRTYICMPPAQFYNWCEVKAKMWILNLGKPVNIPVLNEAMAIELGANLLGEGVIFIIAAAILVAEYTRSSRKEAAKEAAKNEEITFINNELRQLFFQMEEQNVQIKELLRTIHFLESQISTKDIQSPGKTNIEKTPGNSEDVPPSTPVKPHFTANYHQPSSILMTAVQIIEDDYFNRQADQRELGILTAALNYLYKDVYKVPVNMY